MCGEREVFAALDLALKPGEMRVEGANAAGKTGLVLAPSGR